VIPSVLADSNIMLGSGILLELFTNTGFQKRKYNRDK